MKNKYLACTILLAAVTFSCGKDDGQIPAPKDDTTPKEEEKEKLPVISTEDIDYDLSVLEQGVSKDIVFTSGTTLRNNAVMQSFAFRGDGYMYAVQLAATGTKRRLNLAFKGVNSNSDKRYMQLEYFGHGSNIDLEKASDGDYIWVGSYGTQTKIENDEGYYTNNQTVARVKFQENALVRPEDLDEHWYIPGLKNVHPSLDSARDEIAFWGLSADSKYGYFYVYSLSEALAVPKTTETLALEIKRGGNYEDFETISQKMTATVHNLSKITPKAVVTLPSNGPVGTGGNQGFLLHSGRIYHYNGAGNNNDGAAACVSTVTVFDFSGNVTAKKQVMAAADVSGLNSLGITDTGFMESEGIKIYDDALYLGYATRKSTDSKRYVTIFKYPLNRIK